MIENEPIYQLFQKVQVIELDATGYIYERGIDRGHRVYGVRLDEVAWLKNFVATKVWHCESEGLKPV